MTTIAKEAQLCTVIVTVEAEPGAMAALESHARSGLSLFATYDGFVSAALHKSSDGGKLVQYLQWETEQHHHDCIQDSRWDEIPSSKEFMALVASGAATMDVRLYEVIETASR